VEQLKRILSSDDEGKEALRVFGGLVLAVGMVLVFLRKGSPAFFEGKEAGPFLLFVVLILPAVFLYWTGMLGALASGERRAWQGVFVVFGIVLFPPALFKLVDVVHGDPGAALNTAWIFLFTALLAGAAAFVARVRFALLLAGIALTVSWLGLWGGILSGGLTAHFGVFRGLLVIAGLGLLAGALALDRSGWPNEGETEQGRGRCFPLELVTAAAIAAVGAGALSFTAFLALPGGLGALHPPVAGSSRIWEAELLAASIVFIWLGARLGVRGPVYVGAIGLFAFITVVGLALGTDNPRPTIKGWPLLLVAVGAAAFVISLIPGLRIGSLGLDRLGPADRGETPPPR
jgi:hypothetical protein